MDSFSNILSKTDINQYDIIEMLNAEGEHKIQLFEIANSIKSKYWGNEVHARGIIEFSNNCRKNCLYCGIRSGNTSVRRYSLSQKQILMIAEMAAENSITSLVLQSGEITSNAFITDVEKLIRKIKKLSNNKLGITLSLGEQSKDTYQRWFDAGAHRYLLRIETSNKQLYSKIHPNDAFHDYETRKTALLHLREIGYQTGTGVMIGLPFQTIADLANDILFYKQLDIDMCGMGPYIEHPQTPLYQHMNALMPLQKRLDLTLKMIATTRIVMKDINIAASTALDAIDSDGRNKALCVGANILMPNITPNDYCSDYNLYLNKPISNTTIEESINKHNMQADKFGYKIIWNRWGDSLHFKNK